MLGPYRLEATLGTGAMGVVYRAVHEPTGTTVALKVLKDLLADDDVYRGRFLREARVAAEVDNEHLVAITEAGEIDGRYYLAERYIDGRTLKERIAADGPLPVPDLLRIVAEIGQGLDALHRAGIVHRDVKPANVILNTDGRAALTDFGLAKGAAYTALTQAGEILGTLNYVAPELIRGEPASPATDIYALGCLVYECLTGSAPFIGNDLLQLTTAHLEQTPNDPAAGRDDVPQDLSWAALQALNKHPDARPRTARAYSHLLRASAG